MDNKTIHPALLQYEEPDLDEADVTEEDFREAINFIVAIQPPERLMDSMETYDRALEPYAFDIRCANRTLERYATTVLWADPEAMRKCFYRYAADPSFFREDLPKSTVQSILRIAWGNIWQD